MAAEVKMPVRLQMGDLPPYEVGTLTFDLSDGPDSFTTNLAAALRVAANEIERPTGNDEGEVPDAAAHG
ncbi:hypothetical protein [Streptomyces pactum]|uniref:Uncharacterized protein n=1 Tax=Streptomyces pactum TaxID=68249 RepID=A0A1S6JGJ6_9ACTN|nr:hypothetical protein [Streptomyces pactum]AQS70852.1 hypothetical protein B1H29_31720 [Streptomyces pactum]